MQNQYQFDDLFTFPKAILHECKKSLKFEYLYSSFVYSMLGDPVYCIDCLIDLSAETQGSFGSFVSKRWKGCHDISRKPEIKCKESVS